ALHVMPEQHITLSVEQASAMVETCLRMNHLNTLVQREIAAGNSERALDLSERARVRAWTLLNDLIRYGAQKPEGYCEPDDAP
ncbi:MAG TPA: hypothetical protein VMZ27_06515, partial [Candidatus Saccharimonadales bacterium]|nr:hypothetical protein [Candidatus Saccharimonadales bacterium]